MSSLPVTHPAPSFDHASGCNIHVGIPDDFQLESGERLTTEFLRCRLHGPDSGPLVVVSGGISSGRFVTDWWPWAVRCGGPIDLDRVRVLAFDLPPGKEEPGVTISTTDQARLLALVLDVIGLPRADAFVGASYGGCIGLAFAAAFPERIGELAVISAAHKAHPTSTAWRGVQRRLLALLRDCGREAEGVALARQLAMISYRTPEEFARRFTATPPARAGEPYPVCDYLMARGAAYSDATSAARWISLSDSLDRHNVRPEAILCPLTVIGFTSDRLVPIEDSRELAARASNLKRLIEAPSIFGHDAFLKERDVVSEALKAALEPLYAVPFHPPAHETAA